MRHAKVIGLAVLMVLGASHPARALDDLLAPPKPRFFHGREVTYLGGTVVCPFAGLGTRPGTSSDRLALEDDQSEVTVDWKARRIKIVNKHVYPSRQIIADLTFLGTAKFEDGARVPLAVHLKVEKKKSKISIDLHPHWTVRGKLSEPEIDQYDIVVSDGTTETLVATKADWLRVATETKISYTLADELIEVKDNLEGRGPSLSAGGALADLSLGFGTKHINKMLIRAELRSLDASNAALAGQPTKELLKRGAWQLRLTALSSLLSQETLRRDLFLLGLDKLPVVAEGMKQGLQKGETLAFTFRGGKGRVAWGAKEQELDKPLDVARAFLEFNFLGAILARQVTLASATFAAAPPRPPKR